MPDNLKANIHRRHNRFQDWMLYQTRCHNVLSPVTANFSTNNNNNQTVRITHRKRFSSKCENDEGQSALSSCSEDELIIKYIAKKIMHKLQYLINPNEYHDVVQCAQMLTSEILIKEPSLCINDIIDRVITIMITPPNTLPQSDCISTPCSSYQLVNDNGLITKPVNNNNELPLSATVTVTKSSVECTQPMFISNMFGKLTDLEDAISKISNQFVKA
ncbi:unnamed protein product [Adineta ricciae]|uniref:Uncharacterized protein n=1 Tax=Adineta ricciae TaxID=249248 RepID=A0A816E0B9_ADIRI|nr:unnamed protein product [Adineta ricciae]